MPTMRMTVALLLSLMLSSASFAVELVKEGKPLAEIVLAESPLPQVRFAAQELQEHIEKISGAKLAIVTAPSEGVKSIFVGESEYTKKLGLTTSDLKMEGYKVIAGKDHLALIGRDATFPPYPRGHNSQADFPALLKKWQESTGEQWDFPWRNFYDSRNRNAELGFSLYDPTGTLFAVYDFLESLGVRWYMPYHDFGTIIPKRSDIVVAEQAASRNPEYLLRQMWFSFPAGDKAGFIWFKRQKLGVSEMAWIGHGTPYVTRFAAESHPEYYAVVGGKPQLPRGGNHKDPGLPRLAAPLRDAMIRFGKAFFDYYPELRIVSVGPADGYIVMDDRDKAAGWLHEERGPRGRMTDYVWTFINDVAKGIGEKHPDKVVMGLAYSGYRNPPTNIERFAPNVGVTFCQTRSHLVTAEDRRKTAEERQQWLDMLPSGEFYIWEYFLYYRDRDRLAGVPVVFTQIMKEDAMALRGKCKGEYVETYGGTGKLPNPGMNHLNVGLQARLYWQPDLNLQKYLDEYYTLYYGPAREEMKEFFTYAEEVWMRPGSRNVYADDSFMKADDVDRYFDILARARAKAGEGPYAQRIALIEQECQPMKDLFAYQSFFDTGMAAMKAKDSAAAEENLVKAVAAARDMRSRASALNELGNLYRNQIKDNDKALDAYQKAMRLNYRGAGSAIRYNARMSAVGILRQQKRFDEATKVLDEFKKDAARHGYWKIEMLHAYGLIAEEQDRRDDALALYQEALAEKGISDSQKKALSARVQALEGKKTGK